MALLAGTLRRLGAFAEAGEASTAAALGERLGVSPRHRKVLPRWLATLAEEGWLVARGDLYRAPTPLPAEEWERLRRADEGHLDPAVLAALLTGERHALELFLAGGSSGGVMAAVEAYQARIPAGAVAVAVLPDRGERYLDTLFSDDWVREQFGDVESLWADPGSPS